jgi:hypothetical protein
MKTILIIIVVGGVCILAGLFFGAHINRHRDNTDAVAEATEALTTASVLNVDVVAADRLHKGQTNEVLGLLISRIDANIVRLANRKTIAEANQQTEILYETNTLPSLSFALAYHKTNSWMSSFGFGVLNTNDPYGIVSNSVIRKELQILLEK